MSGIAPGWKLADMLEWRVLSVANLGCWARDSEIDVGVISATEISALVNSSW